MKFWWCNQTKDWKQELLGCSSIISNTSVRDEYRKTVGNVKKGDIIFHYDSRKQNIFAISTALENGYYFTNNIKILFENKSISRGPGWKCKLNYLLLGNNNIPIDFEIKKILKKLDFELIAHNYSLFEGYVKETNSQVANFLLSIMNEKINLPKHFQIDLSIEDYKFIKKITTSTIKETEKIREILVRIGQTKFRNNLFKKYDACYLTGIREHYLLRASHIKPWKYCAKNEKTDHENGFLLCAHVDTAFDQGLISFDDNGNLLRSNLLSIESLKKLGLNKYNKLKIKLSVNNKNYLSFHRNKVFK